MFVPQTHQDGFLSYRKSILYLGWSLTPAAHLGGAFSGAAPVGNSFGTLWPGHKVTLTLQVYHYGAQLFDYRSTFSEPLKVCPETSAVSDLCISWDLQHLREEEPDNELL